MTEPNPTQPSPITFPWQLLYTESIAVAGEVSRVEREITRLRYEVDQLERGLLPVLAQRADALRAATQRYEEQSRQAAAPSEEATDGA